MRMVTFSEGFQTVEAWSSCSVW